MTINITLAKHDLQVLNNNVNDAIVYALFNQMQINSLANHMF